jgi:multiple antibiotic resistance protein
MITQLINGILLTIGALLPVVNPLGSAPIFLSMTEGCDQSTRSELSRRIAIYSFALLLGCMLFGSLVLRLFGLSVPIVQVAGGLVVCALGWKILTSDDSQDAKITVDANHARLVAPGRAFYPLTLPLTIDAGDISVAVTVGASHVHTIGYLLVQLLTAFLGAIVVAVAIWLAYRYAAPVSRRVGKTGMAVVLRLSAFITLCIGASICWDGIKSLLAEIGIHAM